MNDERMRILKMIQEGQLTAEEGARLLEALREPVESTDSPDRRVPPGGSSVRIRVVDSTSGNEKLNLNIPIGVAKMFSSFIPPSQREELERHGIRFQDLLRAVESGERGKVIDMENSERNEKVEISIE